MTSDNNLSPEDNYTEPPKTWSQRLADAKDDVILWVSKYETANDPECLKFLLESFYAYCKLDDQYEEAGQPDQDWRSSPSVNALFRKKQADGSYTHHYIEKITGSIIDTLGNKHKLADCEFGYYTKEEIDLATRRGKKLFEFFKDNG